MFERDLVPFATRSGAVDQPLDDRDQIGDRVTDTGDDSAAKDVVRGLLQDLTWPAAAIEDLGGVATARGPEAFIMVVPHILRNHGFAPFALGLAR